MTPLICFYRGDYLLSQDYFQVDVSDTNWKDDLESIERKYFNHTKIIKINYEFGERILLKSSASTKRSLHSTPLISVIVLREKVVLSNDKLTELYSRCDRPQISIFQPSITKEAYLEGVSQTQNGIRNGDIYQLNYTFPFEANSNSSPLDLFGHYHQIFHGDYHALIPYRDHSIISLSPELFLKKEKGQLTTRPIKGTAVSGEKGVEELLKSEKENAELSMIVDLLRNDLNSVADGEGSQVISHRSIMDLGDIVHTYSEVTARSSKNFTEVLESTLPGGSISGCPKKRACEYISKLEDFERGYYSGTLGWWEGEEFEFNILIRSFLQQNSGKIFYHAGGGIVIDSNPQKEYQEALLKSGRINQ